MVIGHCADRVQGEGDCMGEAGEAGVSNMGVGKARGVM